MRTPGHSTLRRSAEPIPPPHQATKDEVQGRFYGNYWSRLYSVERRQRGITHDIGEFFPGRLPRVKRRRGRGFLRRNSVLKRLRGRK